MGFYNFHLYFKLYLSFKLYLKVYHYTRDKTKTSNFDVILLLVVFKVLSVLGEMGGRVQEKLLMNGYGIFLKKVNSKNHQKRHADFSEKL